MKDETVYPGCTLALTIIMSLLLGLPKVMTGIFLPSKL